MNKRYIDFVPVRPTVIKPRAAAKPVTTKTTVVAEPPRVVVKQTEIEIIKSQKIKAHTLAAPTPRPAMSTPTTKPVAFDHDAAKFQTPTKSPFINTATVAKRPLSKNVYEKPEPTPVKESTKPVTIITKPEKDSRAGLVVTIILTIIFGAAVGTVAFLLLPR